MSKALLTELASGKTYLLDGDSSIGRGSDNTVVLSDVAVSGHHATISNIGNAWYIADNGSRNGVEMNNFRVPTEGKLGLRNGCQLKLGNTLLRFTADPEAVKQFEASRTGNREAPRTENRETPPRGNRAPARSNNSPGGDAGASPRSEAGNTGAAQKKKPIRLAWVAALLVIAVLGWCLGNHFIGSRRMKEGDYQSAVTAFKRDFIFSGSQRVDAALSAGEDAYSRNDYSDAIKYFQIAGVEGKERWADSLYEQAKKMISAAEYNEAIMLLNQISYETRAQEQLGVANLKIAQKQFSEGDIDGAIRTAEAIQNTKYADAIAFLDEVYHFVGNERFLNGEYLAAKEAYLKCERDDQAQVNAAVLEALDKKEFYSAALLADSSIKDGTTDISRSQWLVAFESYIGKPNVINLAMTLNGEAAKALLAEKMPFESASMREAFSSNAPKGSMIGSYTSSSENVFVIDDLNEIYSQCGTNPTGKILIVAQKHSYSDRATTQAILLDIMKLLPGEYYPSALEEVEYIVFVNYDYRKDGNYRFFTVALQEEAEVTVLQADNQKQLYKSERIDGAPAPSSFSYYGIPPSWKSGDAPNMGEVLHSVISSIIG